MASPSYGQLQRSTISIQRGKSLFGQILQRMAQIGPRRLMSRYQICLALSCYDYRNYLFLSKADGLLISGMICWHKKLLRIFRGYEFLDEKSSLTSEQYLSYSRELFRWYVGWLRRIQIRTRSTI